MAVDQSTVFALQIDQNVRHEILDIFFIEMMIVYFFSVTTKIKIFAAILNFQIFQMSWILWRAMQSVLSGKFLNLSYWLPTFLRVVYKTSELYFDVRNVG